ncbi:MAG: hemoglobin [Candidatus Paceibacteria bacterium]|jgi:hemoglobin
MSVADKLRELRPGAVPNSLFDRVGGRAALDRVHKTFYDKVYEHDWMKQFFEGVDQETIETHQSDFMCTNMGGGKIFCGREPKTAHIHIEVSEELFDLRHEMLKESLQECGVSAEHQADWLKIDMAFKNALLRKREDCRTRGNTLSTRGEGIISIPKPTYYRRAG